MKMVFAAATLVVLAACDASFPNGTAEKVEYRPQVAGTVDHALCLLGFTAIPLKEARSTGHHLVTARINGREGVFVLDTGANMTVIDTDHAALFGLKAVAGPRGGATVLGGPNVARQAPIESLTIGPVAIRLRRIILTDLGALGDALAPLAGGAVHGLIGQDVLKEHRAVIDVERPLLYLIDADRDPAPIPAERCSGGSGPDSARA